MLDRNPRPNITAWDVAKVAGFVAIQAPFKVVSTTSCHVIGRNPSRLPLKSDIIRSLVRSASENIPLSIGNRLSDRSGSNTLQSIRYREWSQQLFSPVQQAEFSGYWICRGLSSSPKEPRDTDIVVYYMRGSGYAMGHPADNMPDLLVLAECLRDREISASIFSLDYTLAQNGGFPLQLEEAYAAYRYLLREMQITPSQVILMGESSGGHLALSLLSRLAMLQNRSPNTTGENDESLQRPGYALLVSPWIDLFTSSPDADTRQKRDFISKKRLDQNCAQLLRATDKSIVSVYGNLKAVVPQRPPWKEALPPKTWISTGEDDIFKEDIVAFVENVKNDGGAITLQVAPDRTHAWQTGEAFQVRKRVLSTQWETSVDGMMPGYQEFSTIIQSWVSGS